MQNDEYSNPDRVVPMVSIVIPLYVDNTNAIKEVSERIDSYLTMMTIYAGFELILVDDGSIEDFKKVLQTKRHKDLTILETKENVLWNQPAAKNAGMQVAKSDTILLTDIDHFPLPLTWIALLNNRPKPGQSVIFFRVKNGETIPPHKGTVLFTRKPESNFFFHEQLCGNYGFDDTYWWEYHNLSCKILDFKFIHTDTREHQLLRDTSVNSVVIKNLKDSEEPPAVNYLNFTRVN